MVIDSPAASVAAPRRTPNLGSAATAANPPLPQPEPIRTSSGSVSVQLMASLIQRLFARYDAISVTHWSQTSDGQLKGLSLRGDNSPEIRQKAAALSLQAMTTAETQSRIVSSSQQQFLVAAVLPAVDGEAISILFGCENRGNAAQWFEARTREVELAAAHLAIIHRLESVPPPQTSDSTATEPTPRDNVSAPNLALVERLRTWAAKQKQDARWILAIGFAALLIGAIPWQHSIQCAVTCEPALRRFVVAPFDGKLQQSLVGPGDSVDAGQVLAILDGGDLLAQIASLQAKIDQALQRRAAALSSGDGSKSQLERLEVQHLRSEIQMLKSREQNLEIRSPIAGVVVSGDLERAEGIPLQVGENLFEIAPLDRLVAEIAIPESDIANVQIGMPTSIRLDSVAGAYHQAHLTQIHPRSEIRNEASVFIAEAAIDNQDLALRPGMHGTASIQAGRRSVAWLLFHRPYDALRGLIGW
ncbi:efflux RND transporter periplasmic adaptor subunit [Rosistilla oblonga]|uniref:efflux RND transporter periplasmic adaptor subunit n=1 Tax=Rosistilla oblonga TaxID=2527990 RepID=UPI003A970A2A